LDYVWKANFRKEHQISKVIQRSPYGGHWYAAWEIFLDHKIFGVGLKNFRITSGNEKYYNQDVLFSEKRQNTHPHQIHLEFLSETGLFGYAFFITFIILSLRNGISQFLKYKNLYNYHPYYFFFHQQFYFYRVEVFSQLMGLVFFG
jgi:O-antigen ligase